MATYYVAEGGTATDQAKENATSGTYPGGCLSPAGHNAETFAAGESVLFSDEGGVIRATVTLPTSGTSGVGEEITYGVKSGDTPVISGSDDVSGYSVERSALSLPGTSGNYASVPDSAALTISGDIEIQIEFEQDDWTMDAWHHLVSQDNASSDNSSCTIAVDSSNVITLQAKDASESSFSATLGSTSGFVGKMWLKVTVDVDNGSSQWVATSYISTDGTSWTQHASSTQAGTKSFHDSNLAIIMGARGNLLDLWPGKLYRVKIYDGIGGTLVLDANFSAEAAETTSFTESSSNGATVTINQSGDPQAEIVDDDYTSWAASGSGTNEYYLVSPTSSEPPQLFLAGTRLEIGTVGSLTDHQWAWDDNDTLGYDTIYFRDDSGNPVTTEVVLTASQLTYGINLGSHDYITIDGLSIIEGGGTAGAGIYGVGAENITVQNCSINNNYAVGVCGTGSDADNWTVEDCEITGNGATGILIEAPGHTGLLIRRNDIGNNAWSELGTGNFEYTAGIKEAGGAGGTIEQNKVYDAGFPGGDLATGTGIWVDGSSGVVTRYNLVYDCYGFGIDIEIATDCDTLYNVIVRCGANDYTAGIGAWATGSNNMTGCNFFGNTVYDSQYWGIAVVPLDGLTFSNNVFENNIVSLASVTALRCINGAINDDDGSGNVYKNNCLDSTDVPYFITWGSGNDYASVSAWETAVGDSAVAGDNLEGDPGMTDPDNLDCALASDSPCIGAGVNLGADYDDALMPSSTWPDGVVTGDQDDY